MPPRLGSALPVLGLLGLTAFVFDGAVSSRRTLYERDLHLVVLPHTEVFVRSLAAGSWPVWNRSLGFGEPLLGIPSTQVLYPPHWLSIALQPPRYLTVLVAFHVVAGGLGLFALLRRWRASRLAAWLAGGLWCVSGPLLSSVTYWNHFTAFAWLPWIATATDALLEQPSARRLAALAFAASLPILAGSPDAAAMGALAALAAAANRPSASNPPARRLAALAVGVGALALGLTAAQWIPAIAVQRHSVRVHLSAEERESWSMPPALVPQLVLPVRPDHWPLRPEVRGAWFEGREPYFASVYLGLGTLPLVVAALVAGPRRRVVVLALLAAGAAVLALGPAGGLQPMLATAVPPLRALRFPWKWTIVTALAWAALSGLGLDALASLGRLGTRRLWAWVIAAFGLPLFAASATALALPRLAAPVLQAAADVTTTVRPDVLRVTLAGVTALAIAFLRRAPARGGAGAVAVVALAVLEPALAHRDLNPTAPVELLELRPPLADAIARAAHGRVYVYDYLMWANTEHHLGHEGLLLRAAPVPWAGTLALRESLYPHLLGTWGLESAFERDAHGLRRRETADLAALLRSAEGTPYHRRLLQLAHVTHVVALHESTFADLRPLATVAGPFREPLRLFGVPDPLPETYVVSAARHADGEAALRLLVDPTFDPRREAVLAGEPGTAVASDGAAPAGTSRILEQRPDRVVLEADLPRPGYVVLLDGYDEGWQATVDGRPEPVVRANVVFRAVHAGPGRHRIVQAYRPATLRVGALLSVLAAAAAAAMLRSASALTASRPGGGGGR